MGIRCWDYIRGFKIDAEIVCTNFAKGEHTCLTQEDLDNVTWNDVIGNSEVDVSADAFFCDRCGRILTICD